MFTPQKITFFTKRKFQSSKLTDRKAGGDILQEGKKISHLLEALREEKINISTISSGQESHAP